MTASRELYGGLPPSDAALCLAALSLPPRSSDGPPAAPPDTSAPADRTGEAPRALDDVMDRYARGEDEALDELYRLGAPRLRAFLARLSGNLTLAEDLTQDAFLRICSARGSFAEGAPALPWMLAIARNALRDHLRREQVRRVHLARTLRLETPRSGSDTAGGGEGEAIARQMLSTVEQELLKLPPRQREAFVLFRFEGLSLPQVADVLSSTHAAVKILVFRAYTALRSALDEGGQGS